MDAPLPRPRPTTPTRTRTHKPLHQSYQSTLPSVHHSIPVVAAAYETKADAWPPLLRVKGPPLPAPAPVPGDCPFSAPSSPPSSCSTAPPTEADETGAWWLWTSTRGGGASYWSPYSVKAVATAAAETPGGWYSYGPPPPPLCVDGWMGCQAAVLGSIERPTDRSIDRSTHTHTHTHTHTQLSLNPPLAPPLLLPLRLLRVQLPPAVEERPPVRGLRRQQGGGAAGGGGIRPTASRRPLSLLLLLLLALPPLPLLPPRRAAALLLLLPAALVGKWQREGRRGWGIARVGVGVGIHPLLLRLRLRLFRRPKVHPLVLGPLCPLAPRRRVPVVRQRAAGAGALAGAEAAEAVLLLLLPAREALEVAEGLEHERPQDGVGDGQARGVGAHVARAAGLCVSCVMCGVV